MDSALLKYSLLSPFEKKEVGDFIDFLFSKKKDTGTAELSNYKKSILKVSVWTEKDISAIDENKTHINQWQPPTW